MNWRLVFHLLGALALLCAGAMLPSLGLALFYDAGPGVAARTVPAFGVGVAAAAGVGLALRLLTRRQAGQALAAAEGFAVATLGWLLLALLGALPLWLSRAGPEAAPAPRFTYIDAFFETMSGFTTTGSTVFGTAAEAGGRGLIESLPHSFLFWRSLTHWLGGMGIVVLVLALLPALRAGGYQMFQAEVPGPTAERLRPRVRETAGILWGVYLLLSAAETLLLWLGEMPLFDALCHTFGTMATGGFSTKDASIGHYLETGHPAALYFEGVICLFMFLAGCNFLLHFKALHGDLSGYRRDAEFHWYCGVLLVATLVIAVAVRLAGATGAAALPTAVRQALFNVLAITTTTGFCTVDTNLWPDVTRLLLVVLMFMGGCAGSTGGGLKQVRVMTVLRYAYRELLRLLRPQLANRIRLGTVTLEERMVGNILGLSVLYVGVFVVAVLLVSVCLTGAQPPAYAAGDSRLVTSFTAVAATLNNIGPGLAGVGAKENYGWMPPSAKVLLALCMLMGRLEVYSVVVILLPLAWRARTPLPLREG
jgi:trk system potassium uptake protein TrkH